MTDELNRQGSCAEVEERMTDILDGSAPEALYDHIADCDRCRDARYDAERLEKVAAESGADYVLPQDLEAKLTAALEQRPAAAAVPAPTATEEAPGTVRGVGPAAPVAPTLAETATEPLPAAAEEPKPPTPTVVAEEPRRPEPVVARPRPLRLGKGSGLLIAVGTVGTALAIAAGAFLVVRASHKGGSLLGGDDGWRGKVAKISSASGGGKGLQVCSPDGKSCSGVSENGNVPAGSVLVTDVHTRARLELADGTQLSLDRGTRVALAGEKGRRAKLESGGIVADVAKVEGQTARIDLPKGHIEVLGTKFAVNATVDSASVDVSRGAVKLVDPEGRSVTVRAGEEGRAYAGVAPYVSSAPALGDAIAWSESAISEGQDEEVAVRGLGELKAKKPGDSQERDGAVTLTSHAVKVRIAGAMARTEVDEVFTNSTDEVLEGIYRFPIPPDAKIERLALEVDGKLEEGAFVDRDRAAAIWRGAIVNAAPQIRREVREEIVWVPGPWRDPALLEWQRGGRFELRIYPIPKRGSRRVILAYTQVIKPTGGVRRYSYPLAHDPSGTTKVGRFDVDVQVRGHDESFGVRPQGYELAKAKQNGSDQLTMNASSFTPSGDLTVEYALPERDAELTAWAYRPSADETARVKAKSTAPAPKAVEAAKPHPITPVGAVAVKPPSEPTPALAAPKMADDAPYVAIALRPKLPRAREGGRRTFAIVVDSSRSMFGESYKRGVAVATKFVRELDRGDGFTLLACDTDCRVMPGGVQTPSGQAAVEVKRFLETVVPEGASDPTASIRAARSAASSADGGELKIVYIGDGAPTVGAIRPAYVTRAVEDALPAGSGTVTTVAIGADSDTDTLGAMARGGGGVMLPFVPGQTTAEAVYAVMGASYGTTLRDVTVELPSGLTEVAPKRLDTLISGGEQVMVARMDKNEIEGTVVVRGKLGKEGFEQRYPVRVLASEAKGNAFVPRLFAAARITDLEREPSADAKKEAVRLSSAFDVASRFTSLLVLESEAMFKAFGLDNTRTAHQWTGEETASSTVAGGSRDLADPEDDAYGADKDAKGGGGRAKSPAKAADMDEGFGFGGGGLGATAQQPATTAGPQGAPAAGEASPPPAPKPSMSRPAEEKSKKEAAADSPFESERAARRRPPPGWGGRPRNMIPMRRIWERKGSVLEGRVPPKAASFAAIAAAERELEQNANRREAVRKLYSLYTLNGDIERAGTLAERWSEKEPLDPEALTARADVAARAGDREAAIRILGSVVDVRPDDIAAQKRLARLHRWAGRPAVGCRHALALAQLRSGESALLAEAVSCGRRTGEGRMADEMLNAAEERVRKAAETLVSKFDQQRDELSGDLRVEASWIGGDQDLDVAILDPDGNRVSWLGAPTKAVISALDVASTSREGLALRGAKPGEYVIEVVRAHGGGPVRGEVVINVAGARRVVPFNLNGNRETVALARINMESRLVPVSGGGFWE